MNADKERIAELEAEVAQLKGAKSATPLRDMLSSAWGRISDWWYYFDIEDAIPHIIGIALLALFVLMIVGAVDSSNRNISATKCESVQVLVDSEAKWYSNLKACIAKKQDGTLVYYTVKDGKFDKRIVKP